MARLQRVGNKRRRPERGFSLAETLISVTIFVVAVMPFAYLFLKSTQTAGQSQHMTVATNAAQRQIQLLRSIPFAGLGSAANGYNGGTNLMASPMTISGQTVYRTSIPAAQLPATSELPGVSGTIDLQTLPLANSNSGRSIDCLAATVTITWHTGGHAPMSVALKTLLAPGGMNDF